MQPPIIVNDHGYVTFFESVAAAESWMEPIDIENKEYVVFDSEGFVLQPGIVKGRVELFEYDAPKREAELRNVLVHSLSASEELLADMTLEQLIKRAISEQRER